MILPDYKFKNTESDAVPFLLAQSPYQGKAKNKALVGFAKVLSGGRVVGLNKDKPFSDRMLADGVSIHIEKAGLDNPEVEQIILESVVTNLEAGVKLLDKQETALARIGSRLSEMALALNTARVDSSRCSDAQQRFEQSRKNYVDITKATYDHTALFSMGQSKPITVVVPSGRYWEGLSIDRCNLDSPGFRAIEAGKVSPEANGLLLDPESFTQVFKEWRLLCASNRMQWHLVYQKWQCMVSTLKYFLGGRRWTAPNLPESMPNASLRRPHLNN
jgi:hypothetical protein